MARVDIAGKPTGDVNYNPTNDSTIPERIRTTKRSSAVQQSFSWTRKQVPCLVLTSDTPGFDPKIAGHFLEEGFQVSYLPYSGSEKQYFDKLESLAETLEPGDVYAIVAYGKAASLCLQAATSHMPKLAALIAYYPSYIHPPGASFPAALPVQIHLASSQTFGTRHPAFRYPDTVPGFAEHDIEEFDKTAARLAWSRVLGVLRKALHVTVDLEEIWDNHTRLEFAEKDADATMKTMVAEPYVNHVPTMTGGVGYSDLRRFYKDFFIPNNADMSMKTLSRTVGTDRIVDEMLITVTHTCEIPWMLPGVPPTGKRIEVVVVGVVGIRGGLLHHEHIHWDQASVLLQIGLLDPGFIPPAFKTSQKGMEREVKRLPVVGAEGARKCVDETNGPSNELIFGW